ncbi:hypothetical protein [Salinicola sp. MH3R3-1]|uniref:hypothetical protein n=1 Tax=Salinicola sp. MH3R3-1 TaxID=1928762 RepID=UPI000AFC5C4F|nr:hypothetical protein [Salinicola sp. MH3R3-1]
MLEKTINLLSSMDWLPLGIGVFLGAIPSYFIGLHFHRRSSSEAPAWSSAILESVERSQLSIHDIADLLQSAVPSELLEIHESNDNGTFFRFSTGHQICIGEFELSQDMPSKQVVFPAAFFESPDINFTGLKGHTVSTFVNAHFFGIDFEGEVGPIPIKIRYEASGITDSFPVTKEFRIQKTKGKPETIHSSDS